jgi:hypothetical protein
VVQGVTFQTACFKEGMDNETLKNTASSSDLLLQGAVNAPGVEE